MFFRKLASLQNFGLLLVYPSNAGRQFVELCRGDFREFGGNTVNRKCSLAICVTQVEAENICHAADGAPALSDRKTVFKVLYR